MWKCTATNNMIPVSPECWESYCIVDSIKDKGLIPGTRLYVHLSIDEETAVNVGSRHGKPYIIKVDCKQMVQDGYKFYLSNNNVWLTKFVPVKYLTF